MISFSSIAQLILSSTVKGYEREEFMNLICDRAHHSAGSDRGLDLSNFNKWVNGTGQRNGFRVVNDYYRDPRSAEGLAEDIETLLLDSVADLPRLLEELETLLETEVREGYLSEKRKKELLCGTEAEQLANILQFSITQRKETSPRTSPDIGWFFTDIELPRGSRIFVGRERELERIESSLNREPVLFLTGVRGIGKSALAVEYVRRMGKKYKNCVYIRYHRSFRESVIALRTAESSEAERCFKSFDWRFEQLKKLKSDSLVILDGMEVLPEEDDSFERLFDLHCHVLVTTSLPVGETCLCVGPLKEDSELVELFYAHCPRELAEDEEEVLRLIGLVHQHTYAVIMLALTVKSGCITPDKLRNYLIEKGLNLPNDIRIRTMKDGKRLRKPFFDLLQGLFLIQELTEEQRRLMMNLTLMPLEGIKKLDFFQWSGMSAGVLLDLIDLGWIQEENYGKSARMHGLVREMVIETLHPTAEKCRPLVNAMMELCERYSDLERFSYAEHDRVVSVSLCIGTMMTALIDNSAECALYETLLTIYSYKLVIADYFALLEMYGEQLKEQDFLIVFTLACRNIAKAAECSDKYLGFMRRNLKWRSAQEGVGCVALYNSTEQFLVEYLQEYQEFREKAMAELAKEKIEIAGKTQQQLQSMLNKEQRRILWLTEQMDKPKITVVAKIEPEGKHAGGKVRGSNQRKK